MSESNSKPLHPLGVYVKGDDAQVADSPAKAVALAFRGYAHRDSVAAPVEESSDSEAVATEVETPVAKPTPPAKPKDADK